MGMGGGPHFGGMGGGARFGGGPHFGGPRFGGGPGFARAPFAAHAATAPRFSHSGFHNGFHHRAFFHNRFHHRFRNFAFFGADFGYAAYYDGCWRNVWTAYGPQWVNVCGDYYGYGYY